MSSFYPRALILASAIGASSLLAPEIHPWPAQGQKLTLQLVYEQSRPQGWEGSVLAVLDSDSRLLYLVQQQKALVKQIDWGASKEVAKADFSSLPCIRLLDWGEIKNPIRIHRWEPIRGTPYATMRYCDSQYLVDTRSLAIVKQLIDPTQGGGYAFFLPKVGQVLVSKTPTYKNIIQRELYRFDTWELLRQWEDPADSWPVFGPHEDRAYYLTKRADCGTKGADCEVTIRELTTGRVIDKWRLQQGASDCPLPLAFSAHDPDLVVDATRDPETVTSLRNITTGAVIRSIRMEGIIPKGRSVSPDGRYVVAGAWDDPQDSPVSQDFKIWDIETGEVVYETPKYRSVWGSRTHGREVHPSFSYDGKYLILVKERSIELLQINSSGSHTAK